MVWIAKNLEEPIRGVITLAAVILAILVIPWMTDFESFLITRLDVGASVFAVIYFGSLILVTLLCGAVGYYIGKAVTKPLRNIAERYDLEEVERVRKAGSSYSADKF